MKLNSLALQILKDKFLSEGSFFISIEKPDFFANNVKQQM
jgi:hypothetical protein